ncbi:MAG: tyrosine-type recombinase/integrase [Chloroflexi bacterium]|nr:tyrosine-type recombinase/integrase [Chloroflexota bacterium]
MTELMAMEKPENKSIIISMVLDSLNSTHSKRSYEKALLDFFDWYEIQGKPGLNRIIVQRYKNVLIETGVSPSTVNLRISAIRKLAREASENGFIDQVQASGISGVQGVRMAGVRSGNWLTKNQAEKLINTPNIYTLKGIRDRAILAIMLGAGLRRSEIIELTFDHIQQREGRWVIVDLMGKGNRIRTIPIPSWTKQLINNWIVASNLNSGIIFRPINKGGNIQDTGLTSQAIYNIVYEYALMCNLAKIKAHDLRRTFAKLAYKGGAGLDQIQLSLGHTDIKTTQTYLGVEQDFNSAPCDVLGIKII